MAPWPDERIWDEYFQMYLTPREAQKMGEDEDDAVDRAQDAFIRRCEPED